MRQTKSRNIQHRQNRLTPGVQDDKTFPHQGSNTTKHFRTGGPRRPNSERKHERTHLQHQRMQQNNSGNIQHQKRRLTIAEMSRKLTVEFKHISAPGVRGDKTVATFPRRGSEATKPFDARGQRRQNSKRKHSRTH